MGKFGRLRPMKLLQTLSVLVALLILGCGKKEVSPAAAAPAAESRDLELFHRLKNFQQAPATIQEAARAVVRIGTAASAGTGSFISGEGLLLTNNHVLGTSSAACPEEGCFVYLSWDLELGKSFKTLEVFVEPINRSITLDLSLLQIWTDRTKTKKLSTPFFLSLDSTPAQNEIGKELFAIGHPGAHLKKWVAGKVFEANGRWLWSQHYLLPGMSGGPLLSAEGKLVGIVHRIEKAHDESTKKEFKSITIGTNASAIRTFLDETPGAKIFFSVKEQHSPEDILKFKYAYLNGRSGTVEVEGRGTQSMLSLLANTCDNALKKVDEGLRKTEITSVEEAGGTLQICMDAKRWFNCRNPTIGKGYLSCPGEIEKDLWVARFNAAEKLIEELNDDYAEGWVILPAILESGLDKSNQRELELIKAYVDRTDGKLNLKRAFFLLDSKNLNAQYRGTAIYPFLKNYAQVPFYGSQLKWVIRAYQQLLDDDAVPYGELAGAVRGLLNDDHLSIGNKLELEELAYLYEII
jgi:V8-like Glu-specific endopeptidase